MIRAAAVLASLAGPAPADITGAAYAEPTTRYDHGVLGDAIEWGALRIETAQGARLFRLPADMVFEDLSPRLADVTGDGASEVVAVEASLARGARLAVWDEEGRIAATPFIGTRHRWLAPVGAVDLDGDGRTEIAYVDRPHLARVLRVWRWEAGGLRHRADLPGVTNHRIGDTVIAGGLRTCGQGPEMILASSDWSRRIAVTFDGTALTARDVGPWPSKNALAC